MKATFNSLKKVESGIAKFEQKVLAPVRDKVRDNVVQPIANPLQKGAKGALNLMKGKNEEAG